MSTVVQISEAVSLAFHGMGLLAGPEGRMSVKDMAAATGASEAIWRRSSSALSRKASWFPPEVPGEASPSPGSRRRSRCCRSTWPWKEFPGEHLPAPSDRVSFRKLHLRRASRGPDPAIRGVSAGKDPCGPEREDMNDGKERAADHRDRREQM